MSSLTKKVSEAGQEMLDKVRITLSSNSHLWIFLSSDRSYHVDFELIWKAVWITLIDNNITSPLCSLLTQCHHNYHHQRLCWLPSWRRTTHPGPSLSSARRRELAISSSLQGWSSTSSSWWRNGNNDVEGDHLQICCSGCSLEGRSSPQRSGFK